MKKQQQHINLLRRWISGEITASEERDLETAAKQDEALRDAWAGYQANAGSDHEARLTHLRRQLTQKQQKPQRRILRPWMRIAAAIALLLVAGWAVFQTQGVMENDLATNQTEAAPAETRKDTPEADALEGDIVETETVEEEEISTDASPNTITEPIVPANSVPSSTTSDLEIGALTSEKESGDFAYERTNGADNLNVVDKKQEAPAATITFEDVAEETVVLESSPLAKNEIVTAAPPPPSPVAPDVYRTQNQAPSPVRLEDRSVTSNSGIRVPNAGYRVINGYVTDEDGNPLIGASILEEGSANGTVADIDGYYELTISNESETLLVNYTGFETTTVAIGDETEIRVTLNENRLTLDEVVVTDLGSGYTRQSVEEEEVIGNAKPEGGFSDLRKYIKGNVAENVGRANVKIRFYVQANGRPTNISIVNSTNPSLNTEAIRLIEEGPNWEISSGEAPIEILYTVKFR